MKIEKLIKKKSNIYELLLSDNTSLSFYDDTIIHFNLLSNKEVDSNKLKELTIYNQNIEAYYNALKLIKRKLRTKNELTQKLKRQNFSDSTIKIVLNRLEKEGYLDNKMYIKSYINDAINLSLKGPNKINMELKKLGFLEDEIIPFLNDFDSNIWKDRIDKIITKKINSNHKLSSKMLINKIKNDLFNLGYEKYLIDSSLKNIKLNDDSYLLEREMKKELKKLSSKYNGEILKNKLKTNLYKKGFDLIKIENILNKELSIKD